MRPRRCQEEWGNHGTTWVTLRFAGRVYPPEAIVAYGRKGPRWHLPQQPLSTVWILMGDTLPDLILSRPGDFLRLPPEVIPYYLHDERENQ